MVVMASPARMAIASPVDFVIGRAAAAEIVVIHRRQIVVNEAEGCGSTQWRWRRRGRSARWRVLPPQARQDSRTMAGRSRLPPAVML